MTCGWPKRRGSRACREVKAGGEWSGSSLGSQKDPVPPPGSAEGGYEGKKSPLKKAARGVGLWGEAKLQCDL